MARDEVTVPEHRRFMTAGPKAPADARGFVRQKLGHLARIDDVVLMVSELVSNAVRHGPRSRVSLRIIDRAEALRVEVHQISEAGSTLNGDKRQGSGFGLKIVEALSDAWGTGDPEWAGVWFEMKNRAD